MGMWLYVVACCLTVILGGCGGDSAASMSTGNDPGKVGDRAGYKSNTVPPGEPLRGRPVQLRVLGVGGTRRVRIRSGTFGWCPDIPHSYPRITGVREVDRPRAVVLTAYLVGGVRPGCAEVSVDVQKRLWLRQPRDGRPIYDGSQSPPVRRWPLLDE
jgi:hypothetical protein